MPIVISVHVFAFAVVAVVVVVVAAVVVVVVVVVFPSICRSSSIIEESKLFREHFVSSSFL